MGIGRAGMQKGILWPLKQSYRRQQQHRKRVTWCDVKRVRYYTVHEEDDKRVSLNSPVVAEWAGSAAEWEVTAVRHATPAASSTTSPAASPATSQASAVTTTIAKRHLELPEMPPFREGQAHPSVLPQTASPTTNLVKSPHRQPPCRLEMSPHDGTVRQRVTIIGQHHHDLPRASHPGMIRDLALPPAVAAKINIPDAAGPVSDVIDVSYTAAETVNAASPVLEASTGGVAIESPAIPVVTHPLPDAKKVTSINDLQPMAEVNRQIAQQMLGEKAGAEYCQKSSKRAPEEVDKSMTETEQNSATAIAEPMEVEPKTPERELSLVAGMNFTAQHWLSNSTGATTLSPGEPSGKRIATSPDGGSPPYRLIRPRAKEFRGIRKKLRRVTTAKNASRGRLPFRRAEVRAAAIIALSMKNQGLDSEPFHTEEPEKYQEHDRTSERSNNRELNGELVRTTKLAKEPELPSQRVTVVEDDSPLQGPIEPEKGGSPEIEPPRPGRPMRRIKRSRVAKGSQLPIRRSHRLGVRPSVCDGGFRQGESLKAAVDEGTAGFNNEPADTTGNTHEVPTTSRRKRRNRGSSRVPCKNSFFEDVRAITDGSYFTTGPMDEDLYGWCCTNVVYRCGQVNPMDCKECRACHCRPRSNRRIKRALLK
ncbi:hypothetical protein BV898_08879 [Hypsibius exemplaris]|uniref:Uncharacterized protein n=1 Tax=Hypsibius exemplaris TaxID=2072580 RepID=A0A1W0WP83_HYPEX|nr:hypothetical protein BV898_08879 [Hypsibius exemplaris]